jgi:Ni/Co efflux regulator RcnB
MESTTLSASTCSSNAESNKALGRCPEGRCIRGTHVGNDFRGWLMNARSITAGALALAFLALSGKAVLAQGRGQDRARDTTPESANGASSQDGRAANDQDRQGGASFNDQDRQVTRDWYRQNQARLGAGWRDEDRLSPSMQDRLRPGQVLDPELRQHMYWVPPELSERYGPAPRGYRYAIIGGNIVMLDDAYQVHDVFRLDVQVGEPASSHENGWQNGDGRGQAHESFNDQDRQVTRDWYRQNLARLGAGWRDEDRLSPEMQSRLRPGERLDPELRQHMYWVPPELSERYGPAPRGYRYAIIGGNIVLLDDAYQVHDVFRLDVQVGEPASNGRNGWQNGDAWGGQHHASFSEQDREVTRAWYQRHQRNLGDGWRERDRLSPDMQSRLRPGERLDPELRRQMHWLPIELSRRYGPAPHGFRYAIIGGNIVMLDDAYRVHDVFSLSFHS